MKLKFFVFVCGISILLSLWAVSPWLFSNKILYFWDSYLPFDPKISFEHIFYIWREGLYPGYPATAWSWLPYWGLFFLPYIFTKSLSISEGFIYVLLLSFSITNFYLLTEYVLRYVVKKESTITLHLCALAVGILYTFNVYTFFNFYFMFNPGAFILAMLPLNILSLLHIYPLGQQEFSKKNFIWITVFFLSLVGMTPGFTVSVFFLQYLVWILFYLGLLWFISMKKIFSFFTLEIMLFFLIIIFIHLWWFLPAFLGFSAQYSGQSSFGTTEWFDKGFKPSQLLHAMRLMGSGLMINNKFPWSGLYEKDALFTLPLFIFPFLFIISLTFLKRKVMPFLVFLLGMALISLFIVKFSNPPYAWILSLGFHYIPFFGGFRDAFQKAGIYFIFGYFIFIGIGLTMAIDYLKKHNKINLILFILVFLIGSVIQTGPFFLFIKDNAKKINFSFENKEYTFNAKTQVPKEYYDLRKNIEEKCKGETVMLIPRSGYVTDGVWKKYNMSYVGQDILPGLINCNFLSTAMFNYYAESSIRTPYLQLQNKDFKAFNAYIIQNNIKFVLVRKDFLPQGFVTWIYVDPQSVERELAKDSSFTKIYSNDFFTLFEKKGLLPRQYGFNLTKNVVQFQSDLKTGTDYATATEVIGEVKQPVIPNAEDERKKYKKDTTLFASIANCIGCISLGDSALPSQQYDIFSQIKNFIKSLTQTSPEVPIEIAISNKAVLGDRIIMQLTGAIDRKDQKLFSDLIVQYKNHWEEIDKLLLQYKADKFLQNNKKMEVVNFLNREKNTVYLKFSKSYLLEGEFLNNKDNRKKMLALLKFQQEEVKRISKTIFKTNFDNHIFKMRLDISRSGEYTCFINNLNDSLKVTSVSVEDNNISDIVNFGKATIPLKKDSYLTSILYQELGLFLMDNVVLNSGVSKEINIGKLKVGLYNIRLYLDPSSGGSTLVAITRGKRPGGIVKAIDTIEQSGENIILADQLNKDFGSSMDYSRVFEVNLPSEENYYIYLFQVEPKSLPLSVLNLKINRSVSPDDVQFVCSLRGNTKEEDKPLKIIQDSPVLYRIIIPENYNGFLAFNQTFDSNWIAHEEGSRLELPHFISGYANAWRIDNLEKREIIVEYKTQSLAIRNAFVTVLSVILILFAYLKIKGR